jgi:hypothetical protein
MSEYEDVPDTVAMDAVVLPISLFSSARIPSNHLISSFRKVIHCASVGAESEEIVFPILASTAVKMLATVDMR